MNKLIAIMALTGLLAAGCASKTNQGGTYNENNPSYGTSKSETGEISTNTPSSNIDTNQDILNQGSTGSSTAPGGSTSGTGSDSNINQGKDTETTPSPTAPDTGSGTVPDTDQNTTPDSNSNSGDSGQQNP